MDRLLLIAAGICLTGIGIGSFSLARYYNISPIAVILAWISMGFIATVGWDYRKAFRSAAFMMFFCLWFIVHGVLFLVFAVYLSWLYWLLAVPLELVIGYMIAAQILGIRPEPRKGKPPDLI